MCVFRSVIVTECADLCHQELGGGQEAAPEAAGGTDDYDTPLQTEAPAEAAGQETASAAQEPEGEEAAAVAEEAAAEGPEQPTGAVSPVCNSCMA